jgi:hypothetical protein
LLTVSPAPTRCDPILLNHFANVSPHLPIFSVNVGIHFLRQRIRGRHFSFDFITMSSGQTSRPWPHTRLDGQSRPPVVESKASPSAPCNKPAMMENPATPAPQNVSPSARLSSDRKRKIEVDVIDLISDTESDAPSQPNPKRVKCEPKPEKRKRMYAPRVHRPQPGVLQTLTKQLTVSAKLRHRLSALFTIEREHRGTGPCAPPEGCRMGS